MKLIHPLRPIYDEHSKVLILGSFPSVKSREFMFYYANKQNRFWPVLESIYNEKITDRTEFCLRHHIALWDVIHSCTIQGSSDASISDVEVNDISSIITKSQIHTIFTTGFKADSLYKKYIHYPIKHIPLPSTSSANARMHLEDLVQIYKQIKEETDAEN